MRKLIVFFVTGGLFGLIAWIMTERSLSLHPWLTTDAVQKNWQWYNYLSSHDALAVLYIRDQPAYWVALVLLSILVGLSLALVPLKR